MEVCSKHNHKFDVRCPICHSEAYDEGYRAYRNENMDNGRWERALNPYNGVDQDDLFEAWADGYADAGWDD